MSAPAPGRRVRLAQGLAYVALLAALVGALGPAERVRTTYSWPPANLPETTPERGWYTPLLLIRYVPDALTATIPCAPAPALSRGEMPVTVLATARFPERARALAIRRSGERLEVTLGDGVLSRVDGGNRLDGGACAYTLRMANLQWTLERNDELVDAGTFGVLPVVTGFFSEVDLRSQGAPSIEVTTPVHATRTTTRQALAWTIAAIAAAAALLLVSLTGRRRSPLAAAGTVAGRARANAGAVDAVVGVALVFWWVVAPAHFDDGWVVARERMFESSGGFSLYYSSLGVNLPLDYWVEWVHHWLAESSLSLLVNRLPAVLCLAVIWIVTRWLAARALRPAGGTNGVALWTLASVFVAVAVAWDVVVRPEPVTAVFVIGVAACMAHFLERESTAAVALTAAMVAFALTAHTTGVAALAAIVVASPQLLRWARRNAAPATAIAGAGLALFGTLLFVGADLEQRRADAQVVRTFSDHESWRDEVFRYSLLGEHIYGTPLRRASVALILLAVLAFVLRRRREPRTLLDFPAAALTAGLVLFIATPSKWPSHFGALAGLAAVAAACEAARVRSEASRSVHWRAWPFVALAAATGVVVWSWLEREQWNVFDLSTLEWRLGVEEVLPLGRLAALVPFVCLGVALLVARSRGSGPLHAVPWRVASWSGPLIAVPVLVFSAGVFIADAAKTSSWTLTRQNLGTLAGNRTGCGLADDLLVPDRSSARSVSAIDGDAGTVVPAWVPPAPVASAPRYALAPTPESSVSTPWFTVPAERRIGIFVAGSPDASDRLLVEFARRASNGFDVLQTTPLELRSDQLAGDTPWRFLAAGDFPPPHPRATAVRITHVSGDGAESALAVTSPVTYESDRLVDRMREPASRTLVEPNLLMYFPCTRLPELSRGTVEVPTELVGWRREDVSPVAFPGTSPFEGVIDVYDVERLSLEDSENPPADIVAFAIDRRIPGMTLAPPTSSTS